VGDGKCLGKALEKKDAEIDQRGDRRGYARKSKKKTGRKGPKPREKGRTPEKRRISANETSFKKEEGGTLKERLREIETRAVAGL